MNHNEQNTKQVCKFVYDGKIQEIFVDNNNQIFTEDSNKINEKQNKNKQGKPFYIILAILTFVFTSITVIKTFYLRDQVESFGGEDIVVDKKDSTEIILNIENNYTEDINKNSAASELINCINSPVDTNKLPSSVTNVIREIKDYYNQSGAYFSFKYQDIFTGFTVSYNEHQPIYAASTIKAPKDIYIYEMASLGKANLQEKLKYKKSHYVYGSGIIKNSKYNTMYDVKTLLRYSTVISDNVAHNMLMDRFGRKNMLAFWKKLGTNAIFYSNTNWGGINAHDAAIYMNELYRFYTEDEKYGQELMNNFLNASPKFIKGKNNYKVANKSGWGNHSIHDVSIIFADNPYIIVALSNLGQESSATYMSYFNKVNDLTYKLHTEYWKYKMNTCNKIEQY